MGRRHGRTITVQMGSHALRSLENWFEDYKSSRGGKTTCRLRHRRRHEFRRRLRLDGHGRTRTNQIRKMLNALRNAAIFLMLFMTFIFTGCCFCCCFCCCCKPCRGGDSTPVVTQTIVQQQAAVPAPAPVQQFAPAPAPAPMMPAYAPPMQQVPAYNPYAQPMQQQQPMGGLNLNISNNNTNTN